jgi:hypothetical protein
MALKIDDFVIDAHTRGEAVVLTGAPPVKGSIVVVKGGQAGYVGDIAQPM